MCCLDSAYQARIYDIRPGAGFLDGFEQVEKLGLDLRRIAREFYHLSKPRAALTAFLHAESEVPQPTAYRGCLPVSGSAASATLG